MRQNGVRPLIRLSAVRVGQPRLIPDSKPWLTAFFKDPVDGAVHLTKTNLYGDRQADLNVHGGADKAVCAYSVDHYVAWRRELGVAGCGPGWFGENFSVENQTEHAVCIGDVYRIGTALVEISQPRGPCWKLGKRWNRPDMPKLVVHTGRSGWYLRVLEEGHVSAGDELVLLARPYARWTIAMVNDLTYARGARATDSIASGDRHDLGDCAALAAAWRRTLERGLR